jgi:hypothetical protein
MNFIRLRQLRSWVARLCGLFQRARREREFAEELESHLAMHIEDNLRAGIFCPKKNSPGATTSPS